MSKFRDFIKNMRLEYKIASIFVIIFVLYMAYTFVSEKFFSEDELMPSGVSSGMGRIGAGSASRSSISEAVTADRPVIISVGEMKEKLPNIALERPEIKGIELATEVENPTVWIYMANDGLRKDDLAADYCKWLWENGVKASSVMILDEAARAKGKIIDIGEKKCM